MKVVLTSAKPAGPKSVELIKSNVPFKFSTGGELLIRSGLEYVLGLETGNVYSAKALDGELHRGGYYDLYPDAEIHI